MARSLGMHLVAEGVETDAQRAALAQGDLGVDELQGFLFSRPVDAEAIAQLLGARRVLGPARLAAHSAA